MQNIKKWPFPEDVSWCIFSGLHFSQIMQNASVCRHFAGLLNSSPQNLASIVDKLAREKFSFFEEDEKGRFPAYLAARSGKYFLLEKLHSIGVWLEKRHRNGFSLATVAVKFQQANILICLHNLGFSLCARDKNQHTAATLATTL